MTHKIDGAPEPPSEERMQRLAESFLVEHALAACALQAELFGHCHPWRAVVNKAMFLGVAVSQEEAVTASPDEAWRILRADLLDKFQKASQLS